MHTTSIGEVKQKPNTTGQLDAASRLQQLDELIKLLVRHDYQDLTKPTEALLDEWNRLVDQKIQEAYPGRPYSSHRLDIAIDCCNEGASLAPDDRFLQLWLNRLGYSYNKRFDELGEAADIHRSIDSHTRALQLSQDPDPDQNVWLFKLGRLYWHKFQRLQDLSGLDMSVRYHAQALATTPDGDSCKYQVLSCLSSVSHTRFENLGMLSDIGVAINCHRQAMLLRPGDPSQSELSYFGDLYRSRFRHLGEIGDIDKAISYHNQGLALAYEAHEPISRLLNNLGSCYDLRFEYFGDLADLDKAIECKHRATIATADDDPMRYVWLNNLGNSYHRRFGCLGRLQDIEATIGTHIRAMSLTPDGFLSLGKPNDLEKAIDHQRQAVSLVHGGHPDKPLYLFNMARSYVSQYHRFRRLEDLDMAIEQLGEAVRLAPDGHLDKSLFLAELGHLHHHHYHHSEDSPQLHQSISCFKRAAQSTTGKASTRFQASQEWAEISFDHKIGESSVIEAHQQAIALIPQVVWFGKTVKSRYESTKEVSKAVTKAFRVAVALKRCDLALEWLEAGRSVVWTQMLQLRTPLDDLRSRDSDLATKLQRIARELERAGLESLEKTQVLKDSATLEETAQCRRHLAVQWEQLTAQIRQISGFHDFMRPKTFQDFRKADLKRTLVVINVHDEKSHAIALHPHWAHGIHMPLPSLTLRGASEMRRKLLNLLQGVQVRGSTGRRPIYPASDGAYEFESVMKLLWTDVVRPVLDGLGFLDISSTDPLPHLIWCTTGPLTSLPLHAAGCYDEPHTRTYNYVVSSYTPTMSALLKPSCASSFQGILAVGQEASAGYAPLPGTVAELERLEKHAQAVPFMRLEGKAATAPAVLHNMGKYSWIHLACHASQNTSNPTASSFHLHDSQLDLATLAREPLEHAELAFLSACETAAGDEMLPDEAIHLAAGMLMIGYRTVIATMWSIKDEDAPIVTDQFYSELLEGGVPNTEKAAKALHDAVGRLRDRVGEKELARWAPFVHFGQ